MKRTRKKCTESLRRKTKHAQILIECNWANVSVQTEMARQIVMGQRAAQVSMTIIIKSKQAKHWIALSPTPLCANAQAISRTHFYKYPLDYSASSKWDAPRCNGQKPMSTCAFLSLPTIAWSRIELWARTMNLNAGFVIQFSVRFRLMWPFVWFSFCDLFNAVTENLAFFMRLGPFMADLIIISSGLPWSSSRFPSSHPISFTVFASFSSHAGHPWFAIPFKPSSTK